MHILTFLCLQQLEVILQRNGWVYLLIFGVIVPYLWTFVWMFAKVAFGRHANPSIGCCVYVSTAQNTHMLLLNFRTFLCRNFLSHQSKVHTKVVGAWCRQLDCIINATFIPTASIVSVLHEKANIY